jgi:hypothetical protein
MMIANRIYKVFVLYSRKEITMFRTRSYLLCLLLVLTLVGVSSITAQEEAKVTSQTSLESVEWSLSAEQCNKLEEDLSGTGEKTASITTTEAEDGSKHVVEDVIISGTASDSTGTYNYVYANRAVRDIPPEGDGPTEIFMIDSFFMQGTGEAELNEAFIWSWTFTPPAEEWPPVDNWEQMHTLGDPLTCDPL